MTFEEAKDVLENTYIRFGRCGGKFQFNLAIKKALEAINKQIPQKVIVKHYEIMFPYEYYCPVCDSNILNRNEKCNLKSYKHYCDNCGQKLTFDGVEDD